MNNAQELKAMGLLPHVSLDKLATMEAAVSTVTNYVMTVSLPLTAVASVLTLSLISLFHTYIISCQLLAFPPQTPPPRM